MFLDSAVQKECRHPLNFLRCDLHTSVSLVRIRPANAIIELLINVTDRGSSQLFSLLKPIAISPVWIHVFPEDFARSFAS